MSGLEKIADSIKSEAKAKADEIIAEAKAKVKHIEDTAAAVMEKQKRADAEVAEREADKVFEIFASENRQNRKQALLKARSDVIDSAVSEAKSRIENLPPDQYFDLMYKICVKNAQRGEGRLYFARKDYDRLPDGFVERCNKDIKDGSVVLEGATDQIDGGFMIVYGKIEQNCSVDSLFETNKNQIWDAVNKSLNE